MQEHFWQRLLREKDVRGGAPFTVLAPMYDVTDIAFRQMFVRYGKPDVMYTEFTSAEGIIHPEGVQHIAHLLRRETNESPLVAHLFSASPDAMRAAARHVAMQGFDGIDINMGCPVKNIQKQGCGAAMMRDPDNAVAVVHAARAGIADAGCTLPVSVKTRIGYMHGDEWHPWLTRLMVDARPDALAVHLRTKREMSDVPAHWELMPAIAALRAQLAPTMVLIGNGDVTSMNDGDAKARATGCDGIMVGRGVFGNPWFFNRHCGGHAPSHTAQLRALMEHIDLYEHYFDGVKNFAIMKRHFKAYVHGFDGASAVRAALMDAHTPQDAHQILELFFQNNHVEQ